MEYYNNIFCISKPDLTDGNPGSSNIKERQVMSVEAYNKYCLRNPHVRIRKGGGPRCPALLNYELLRSDIKQKLADKYGDLHQANKRNKLIELIKPDYKAATFFTEYLFDDGTNIKPDRQVEYCANATILNAVGRFIGDKAARRRGLGGKTTGIWQVVSEAVNNLDKNQYKHTLPSNALRLREKYHNYQTNSYAHLVHKGNKNRNAKKKNQLLENLIISIYCMRNIPFGSWVYDDYMQFVAGAKQIIDKKTGVIFDREDYFDDARGTYIIISKSTVWNILHDPVNVPIIDRLRNNRIDHITQMCPYDHRKNPDYSLSMISMDDRTFSRKTTDGKWLNAYVGADIMSEVILGIAFTLDKPSVTTVWECFREMHSTISSNNLMWPGELECENHLMRSIETQLREMFQYVTFCQPGIGRSKYIENIFRRKKYGDEKRHQVGIGRHNQKGAFKTKSNNKDDDYKQPRLPVETLIAEEMESIQRWNHDLHPNQKKFPGKTRWQVLEENMHPDLGRPQNHKLLRHVGLSTVTSIRNQDFAQVQYENYAIDQLESLSRLKPNSFTVQAYYLPGKDGSIPEVYLYQDEVFITRATKVERYQKSKLEETPDDVRIRTERSKRNAHYFKMEKDALETKITREIEVVSARELNELPEEVETIPEPVEIVEDNYEEMAKEWSSEIMRERAITEA